MNNCPLAPQDFRTQISYLLPLEDRIRRWISRLASEEVADRFYPWVQGTLQDLGQDLEEPVSDKTFEDVIAALRKADVTPSRMEHALEEARQAREQGLSTLEWIREIQSRAFTGEMAQKSIGRAERRLKASSGTEVALQSPPSAEQIFVFFLIWEEMGGTTTFATIREAQRREEGIPPAN